MKSVQPIDSFWFPFQCHVEERRQNVELWIVSCDMRRPDVRCLFADIQQFVGY